MPKKILIIKNNTTTVRYIHSMFIEGENVPRYTTYLYGESIELLNKEGKLVEKLSNSTGRNVEDSYRLISEAIKYLPEEDYEIRSG